MTAELGAQAQQLPRAARQRADASRLGHHHLARAEVAPRRGAHEAWQRGLAGEVRRRRHAAARRAGAGRRCGPRPPPARRSRPACEAAWSCPLRWRRRRRAPARRARSNDTPAPPAGAARCADSCRTDSTTSITATVSSGTSRASMPRQRRRPSTPIAQTSPGLTRTRRQLRDVDAQKPHRVRHDGQGAQCARVAGRATQRPAACPEGTMASDVTSSTSQPMAAREPRQRRGERPTAGSRRAGTRRRLPEVSAAGAAVDSSRSSSGHRQPRAPRRARSTPASAPPQAGEPDAAREHAGRSGRGAAPGRSPTTPRRSAAPGAA